MTDRIPLTTASAIAGNIVEMLRPCCHRIEIAGSIRRRRPTVKDIEIVAVPKLETEQVGLFGEHGEPFSLLKRKLESLVDEGVLTRRLDAHGRTAWGERHQRAAYNDGDIEIGIDVFGVLPPAQWGVIFAIRTGSAEFSRVFMTQREHGGRMPANLRVIEGALWRVSRLDRNVKEGLVETPEEGDFFRAIGFADYPAPEDRC